MLNTNNTNLPTDNKELEESLPVHHLSDDDIKYFCDQNTENKIKMLWIGHATSILNMENCIILVDPVFSDRCSPSQYVGPKRFRPVPITIDRLPKLDAVIVSHNHYDHLDYNSVKSLNNKFGNKGEQSLHWFAGIGMKSWFKSCGIEHNVHELDWWDSFKLKTLDFTFTPSQHWCTRGANDYNKVFQHIHYTMK
jgi:N-acyl-phosphatidylethanolamine-hydrolysing phospholipase D